MAKLTIRQDIECAHREQCLFVRGRRCGQVYSTAGRGLFPPFRPEISSACGRNDNGCILCGNTHSTHTHTHNIRGCVVYVYDPICENIMTSSVPAPWPRLPGWRRRRRRNVVRKFSEALQSMSEARTTRDHRTNCICLGTLQICTAYNFESRPENWAKVFWPIATTFTYIYIYDGIAQPASKCMDISCAGVAEADM